jgi:hypothetical protein
VIGWARPGESGDIPAHSRRQWVLTAEARAARQQHGRRLQPAALRSFYPLQRVDRGTANVFVRVVAERFESALGFVVAERAPERIDRVAADLRIVKQFER